MSIRYGIGRCLIAPIALFKDLFDLDFFISLTELLVGIVGIFAAIDFSGVAILQRVHLGFQANVEHQRCKSSSQSDFVVMILKMVIALFAFSGATV